MPASPASPIPRSDRGSRVFRSCFETHPRACVPPLRADPGNSAHGSAIRPDPLFFARSVRHRRSEPRAVVSRTRTAGDRAPTARRQRRRPRHGSTNRLPDRRAGWASQTWKIFDFADEFQGRWPRCQVHHAVIFTSGPSVTDRGMVLVSSENRAPLRNVSVVFALARIRYTVERHQSRRC